MSSATIGGAPAGHNCRLSAAGYGKRTVRVMKVAYGFSVIGATDEAARSQAFYPMGRALQDFTLTFIFSNEEQRNSLSSWLVRFGTWSSSRAVFMRVAVPTRNFFMYGVPSSGMVRGGNVGVLAPTMAVPFTAALDPKDPQDSLSQLNRLKTIVRLPKNQPNVGATFYPSGNQVAGDPSIDEHVYGSIENTVASGIGGPIIGTPR